MNAQLLEVQPRELAFIFELKKQSSCEVQLTNNTFHNVAFKVKTTSPKKYCVRPNVGIVLPKSTCEFTVTMQAPKTIPSEMLCKDKFLIQSTVVPFGMTDKDITPDTFNKDDDKSIEELKLRVVLISPPQSPVLSPISGGPLFDPTVLTGPVLAGVDDTAPLHSVAKNREFKMIYAQDSKTEKVVELKPKKDVIDIQESKPAKNTLLMPNNDFVNGEELKQEKDVVDDKLARDAVKDTIRDKLTKDAEFPSPNNVEKETISGKPAKDAEFPSPKNVVKDTSSDKLAKDAQFPLPKNAVKDSIGDALEKDAEMPQPENKMKDEEILTVKAVKELKLVSDIGEIRSKLNLLESKLNEAEATISNLTEERRVSIQERKILQEELVVLKSRTSAKRVQVGFPLLFVVVVALVSLFLGYHSHPRT